MIFVAFELLWIGQAIRTFSADLGEFITSRDRRDRVFLTLYWMTTLAIVLHLAWLVWVFFVRPYWNLHKLHYF